MCSTQQQGESEVTSPRAGQPSTAAAPAPVAPAAPEETAAAAEQQEDCAASHAGVSCSAADTDSLPRRPPGRPARISGCQVCGCSLENTKSRFYKVSGSNACVLVGQHTWGWAWVLHRPRPLSKTPRTTGDGAGTVTAAKPPRPSLPHPPLGRCTTAAHLLAPASEMGQVSC